MPSTVYYWKPNAGILGSSKKIKGEGVGHAALEIDPGTSSALYISYYPASGGELFGGGWSSRMKVEEEDTATAMLTLHKPDTKAMRKYWDEFVATPQDYHLFKHNCSTMVFNCLCRGYKAFEETASFDETARGALRYLWPANWEKISNGIDAIFLGQLLLWTPGDVWRLAQFIETIYED